MRAIVAVRQPDAAIFVEVQVVRFVTVRRSRPTEAVEADIEETAIAVVARTRSRIPYRRCTTELAGEVHASIGAVVGVPKIR